MQNAELDELVATRVMDYKVCGISSWWVPKPDSPNRDIVLAKDFRPSTDIAAAWRVVERMEALNYDIVLYSAASGEWGCTVLQGGIMRADPIAPTAPLAICHATLLALGVEVPR